MEEEGQKVEHVSSEEENQTHVEKMIKKLGREQELIQAQNLQAVNKKIGSDKLKEFFALGDRTQ